LACRQSSLLAGTTNSRSPPMASSEEVRCSRCGVAGHAAVDCKKPFMKPQCSQCNRLGHLKANCPQLRQCLYCQGLGHLARDCPVRAARDARRAQKSAESAAEKSAVKEDDQVSVQSNSTAATSTDIAVAAPAPQKCSFCGTARVTPKFKRGSNACKDRCQSCFRAFK